MRIPYRLFHIFRFYILFMPINKDVSIVSIRITISHKILCVFLSFTIIKLPVRILLSRKEVHTLCSFSSSPKERNSSERFLPSIVLTSITETYYGPGSRRCPTLKMMLSCLLHFCLSRPFPTFLPQHFSLYIIAF